MFNCLSRPGRTRRSKGRRQEERRRARPDGILQRDPSQRDSQEKSLCLHRVTSRQLFPITLSLFSVTSQTHTHTHRKLNRRDLRCTLFTDLTKQITLSASPFTNTSKLNKWDLISRPRLNYSIIKSLTEQKVLRLDSILVVASSTFPSIPLYVQRCFSRQFVLWDVEETNKQPTPLCIYIMCWACLPVSQ